MRIPRGHTLIAETPCNIIKIWEKTNWLLSWTPGSQVFRKVGTPLVNNEFGVCWKPCTHMVPLAWVADVGCLPRPTQCTRGGCETTHNLQLLFASEAAQCIQTLWRGHIHSLQESIRVRRMIFQERAGPEESKQKGLLLKLREWDLKINIRMLWKHISQSNKLCRETCTSPCPQLLFLCCKSLLSRQISYRYRLPKVKQQEYSQRWHNLDHLPSKKIFYSVVRNLIIWAEWGEKNRKKIQANKLYFFSNKEFYLGLFKKKGEEISGWEIMRKDSAINRLGQKKAELKILKLHEIPFPDLPHHKKKKRNFL